MEKWDAYIVVDDNRFDILIGTKIMSMIFPNLYGIEFSTGKELLDYVKNFDYGDQRFLVLLDLNMPEMSGYDFLELFRELPSKHKDQFDIIVITASALSEDKTKSESYSEVAGYQQKPLLVHTMKDLLNNLFGVSV